MIKRYLILRKKYDIVKIISALVIIGIIFLILGGREAYSLYNSVNAPVEYTASGKARDLAEINNMDNVIYAGEDITNTVAAKYKTIDLSITYEVLPEEYLKSVYGIDDKSLMQILYMNKKAYDNLLKNINSENTSYNRIENVDEVDLTDGSGDIIGKAKIYVVDIMCHENDEYIISSYNKNSDNYNSHYNSNNDGTQIVRIMFDKGDMDGTNVRSLEAKGYFIINSSQEVIKELNNSLIINKIKYNLTIAGFCLIFVGILIINIRKIII